MRNTHKTEVDMKKLSVAFAGHRASKLPYNNTSKEHERLEKILKAEIVKLIRLGVSEFYVGGQTGIDTLAALLVMNIKEEFGTTANLNLVMPYKGMENSFTVLQKENYEWIKQSARTVTYLNEKYTPECYRQRNRYMIDKSDYLIAVSTGDERSGTQMTINMAKKKGIEIRIIDPIFYEVRVIKSKYKIRFFD